MCQEWQEGAVCTVRPMCCLRYYLQCLPEADDRRSKSAVWAWILHWNQPNQQRHHFWVLRHDEWAGLRLQESFSRLLLSDGVTAPNCHHRWAEVHLVCTSAAQARRTVQRCTLPRYVSSNKKPEQENTEQGPSRDGQNPYLRKVRRGIWKELNRSAEGSK